MTGASSFREIRDTVFRDPYETLPAAPVSLGRMFARGKNLLLRDSHRILDETVDLRPRYDKLLHGAGVVLAGKWIVDEETPWTGGFSTGTEHLCLARVSTLLGRTTDASRRGFGIAFKLFPTTDPDARVTTANCVVIDTLLGARTKRFVDTTLTNHPPIGWNPSLLRYLGASLNVLQTFFDVDRDPTFRPLSEVGAIGTDAPRSPKYLRVSAAPGTERVNASDFRDELDLRRRHGPLTLVLEAADESQQWRRIGRVVFEQSVASDAGDHRLHFHHASVKPGKLGRPAFCLEALWKAKRYIDAWNAHDVDRVVGAFLPWATYEDPTTGGPIRGPAIREATEGLLRAFPDLRFELKWPIMVLDGTVAAQWVLRGTQAAPFLGVEGNRRIAVAGADFIRVENHAIRRIRGYYDVLDFQRQMRGER